MNSVLVEDFENGTPLSWFLGTGSEAVPAGAGREGNALRLVASGTTPVVLAAALLAPSPRRLGSLDSIVFWARGSGRIRVAIEYSVPGTELVAWIPWDLDSSWQRVRVRPASEAVDWEEVRDRSTHLSFYIDGTGEVWIDDPRLFGINRDDLD